MIAVMIADYFILGRKAPGKSFDLINLIIWLVGFELYRLFMGFDIPVGSTLPAMAATVILCLLAGTIRKKAK